ncbi:MAG: cyclic nucleotide-binding domain-containing protein [Bacteroidota bacterium]
MTPTNETTRLLLIERVFLLKSLTIFSDTPETILAEIAELMQEEEVEAGKSIVREGDTGQCMYIIFKGKVRIHKGDHDLAKLSERDFFGELSLLDTEKRSATATAITDCTLFRIDQDPFYDVLEQRPEVIRGVMKILCKRLRAANHRISELTHADRV